MHISKISGDNPPGQIFAIAEKSKAEDTDNLDLDEAITREVPALERGLSTIKLLIQRIRKSLRACLISC